MSNTIIMAIKHASNDELICLLNRIHLYEHNIYNNIIWLY